MTRERIPLLIERLGLAFCFLSIGLWELVDPAYWFGYVPSFAQPLGDMSVMVRIHGATLVLIAAAVLSGFRLRIASGLATLMLLQIVAVLALESGFTEILVRDIAILALAAAVFARTYEKKEAPAAIKP